MSFLSGVKDRARHSHHSFVLYIISTFFRFFQFVLGLTVCGLYGVDLNNARKAGVYPDGKWIYAEVVGALSALSALILMVPFVKSYLAFGWDVILFILWTAVFGIFGKMYIHENAEGNDGIQRMKNAVWVDLTNMLLWLVTALYGVVMFFSLKNRQSLHTGRANV